jgi:hypothetical protein
VPQLKLLVGALQRIEGRLAIMATQESVDALTAKVTDAATKISTATDNIRQDIADLKAANPQVDTTALEASVDALAASVGGLDELDAENEPTV